MTVPLEWSLSATVTDSVMLGTSVRFGSVCMYTEQVREQGMVSQCNVLKFVCVYVRMCTICLHINVVLISVLGGLDGTVIFPRGTAYTCRCNRSNVQFEYTQINQVTLHKKAFDKESCSHLNT